MIVTKLLLIFVSVILVLCEAGYVDTIKSCSIKDLECQKGHIHDLIRDASKSGISELGIPVLDPMKIKNEHITVLDLVDISISEGTVKGLRSCKILKYFSNFETGHVSAEVVCDLTISAKYNVTSSSPLIKTFLGGETVHGEGNGKVKIEKLKLSFEFPFELVRRNNNLYINCQFEKSKYTFDVLGRVHFYADQLYLGQEETSKTITKLMNENWKAVMDTAAKSFLDIAMKYVYEVIGKFCNGVPVNVLVIEDLSQYATS